jgi:hypothetical protein
MVDLARWLMEGYAQSISEGDKRVDGVVGIWGMNPPKDKHVSEDDRQAWGDKIRRIGREACAGNSCTPDSETPSTPSPNSSSVRHPASYPQGRPQPSSVPTHVDADGFVYEKPFGSDQYRPKTTIGDIQQRDTSIDGIPVYRPTIGGPVQARDGVLGPPLYGPQDQPLFERRNPGPISGP